MATKTLPRTYMPADQESLTSIGSALTVTPGMRPAFALRGPLGEVEIPETVYEILQAVVDAMQDGKAITITPSDPVLTTQQAADLLGVTRPTLVKMLDDGKMPFERISTRRKVRLQDVLEFREQRRVAQYRTLETISAPFDEDDLDEALVRARAARKRVARRRREQRGVE